MWRTVNIAYKYVINSWKISTSGINRTNLNILARPRAIQYNYKVEIHYFDNVTCSERAWMMIHCIKESQTNEKAVSIRGNVFFVHGEIRFVWLIIIQEHNWGVAYGEVVKKMHFIKELFWIQISLWQ